MAIPTQLTYTGDDREFQFRDNFIMPLLLRLGFGVVTNYHGSREFGRDVIFGDLDRFGHVIYYGMQIKYEPSIGLGDSHGLIQDAEQATHNPFTHPQTGRAEYISCFYVANAGVISDQARTNFFSTLPRRGIRDARMLDGNALLLLDRAASLNRNAQVRERLTGLLQEVRVNRNLNARLLSDLKAFVQDPDRNPYPMLRFRNCAIGNYLNAPFVIPGLPIDVADQFWQIVRMLNDIADSLAGPISVGNFRKHRLEGAIQLATQMDAAAIRIELAVTNLLNALSGSNYP